MDLATVRPAPAISISAAAIAAAFEFPVAGVLSALPDGLLLEEALLLVAALAVSELEAAEDVSAESTEEISLEVSEEESVSDSLLLSSDGGLNFV